ALIATAAGYACVTALTLPVAVHRAGLSLRLDIAGGLLAFGLPLVTNIITTWILQLSDRYLLSQFGSLTQTASYDVAYKLGGAVSPVILAAFMLAWPTALYTIAKRDDAPQIFQQVFALWGPLILFATYALSLAGVAALRILFPPTYQPAAPIIPIIG